MTDVKFSQLTVAAPMGNDDYLAGLQNGVTVRFSRASLGLARSGANTDITSLQMGTGFADLLYGGVMGLVSGGSFLMTTGSQPHPNPALGTRGLTILRQGSANTSELQLFGNNTGVGQLVRTYAYGPTSTIGAPTATVGGQGSALAMCGYDGSGWSGARALVSAVATTDWTTSSTPTNIIFETTPVGSLTRMIRWVIGAAGNLVTAADNVYSLGSASARPSVIYAATGTINTSDAREKTEVRQMSDAEIAVAKALVKEIGFYKFLSAIAEKGDDARLHCGMTVQRAIELFEAEGLDPFSYSFICHDTWEAEHTDRTLDDGSVERVTRAAGDRFSFRESGLVMFMLAGINARLEALEI
ncbi:tail fiber domain-containing protein [Pseudomonas tolaasii]